MADLREELSKEAYRIEEDSLYSAKRHYNAADRWRNINLCIGIPSAAIAATAGCFGFLDWALPAGALAVISTALIIVSTFLRPFERSDIHKSVAGQYLELRNHARIFRDIDLIPDIKDNGPRNRLKALDERRNALNQKSPGTAKCDDKKAVADIEAGRAVYEVDKEG
ncbi:SLATT domain-containing protein [Pontiellaceae bacterium B12227]|nr:SLATT domain-containing protein [Pontiellaceae bacterium B12227]